MIRKIRVTFLLVLLAVRTADGAAWNSGRLVEDLGGAACSRRALLQAR